MQMLPWKSQFLPLLNISLEWSPLYYHSQSCGSNDLWTNDSPHFFFTLFFFQNFIIFSNELKKFLTFCFWKMHIWYMFEWMHEFFKKCTYEYMIFFFWMHIYSACLKDFSKRNAFMNAWFLFECIYDVCLNDFFLWENAFMKFWTFSFWKCIYEFMIFFNAYIVYVWMILFYFMRKCIYEILDFFFLIVHLWMDDFFLDLFLFSFHMYACIIFLRMHI